MTTLSSVPVPVSDPSAPDDATARASVGVALRSARAELAAAGVISPEADAELLLGAIADLSRGQVQAAAVRGDRLEPAAAAAYRELVRRRAAREPLQHLIGRAPFRHLVLHVGPGVFVPRPETETVAQLAVDALRAAAAPEPVAVDLGTGSGAIALAMATEVPHARVLAVENSAEAYVWARRNFDEWAPDGVLVFGDLTDALPEWRGRAAVVVSNPPYIPDDALPRDPQVLLSDPPRAVYGGPDGLEVVRAVSGAAQRLLHPGGTLVLEHGDAQGAAVRDLLSRDGWVAIATHRDPTGRDRATTALMPTRTEAPA